MTRKGIGPVVTGAVLLIAAVVGFIVVPEHRPDMHAACPHGERACLSVVTVRTGLSQATYDALRIATWAVLIVGLLLIAIGLIRYARPEAVAP